MEKRKDENKNFTWQHIDLLMRTKLHPEPLTVYLQQNKNKVVRCQDLLTHDGTTERLEHSKIEGCPVPTQFIFPDFWAGA